MHGPESPLGPLARSCERIARSDATVLITGETGVGKEVFARLVDQSNIAEQFVRMIAAQRAFEANSKTITTADQLLSELIAMKR